jgi:ankyrin repeat protein
LAAEVGNLDVVTILVEYGVEVDKRNYDTNTPLDLAELEGHSSVVEYLKKFEVESHYQEPYYF